jgi:glycosyltransferase involved in cell wall biosynthesis
VEINSGGHRYLYVRFLLEADPGALLVLDADGLASPEYRMHLAQIVDSSGVEVRVLPSSGSRAALLADAADLARAAGCDRLVFPDGDLWLAPLAQAPARVRRGLACTYLVMRTPFRRHGRLRDAATLSGKEVLARAVALRWRDARGYFLTDSTGVVVRRPFLRSLRPLPDPQALTTALSRDEARGLMGMSEADHVVGILGGIDGRKHPELLLDALPRLSDDVRVLLCGRMSDGVATQLAGAPAPVRQRVTVRDGMLSDEELATALRACDAVVLLHDLDGPSGIMANALGLGIPVVVGEAPWLRAVVRELDCGVAADHEVSSVAEAVAESRRRDWGDLRVTQASPQTFADRLLGLGRQRRIAAGTDRA